ncbi:MAG: permease prefix domain 2-containing transporter [Cyclobacteriaceae bacterium]
MKKPPQIPLRFFRWFCHPQLRDHIEGDLTELYYERVKQSGKRKADFNFVVDVLLLFRPGIIGRGKRNYSKNNLAMLKNYFKIGWRSMIRQRMYSFIKIGGFAIGIAACLLNQFIYKRRTSLRYSLYRWRSHF